MFRPRKYSIWGRVGFMWRCTMIRYRMLLSCVLLPLAWAGVRADEPPLADKPNDKIEVDARGPVHEAYAQPWQTNPGPNEAVDKKPPEPIAEEPAAEKPTGKNVQWVPGYWQFDADRK